MPTVWRWKGYRFFFYSADGWEPPHIHVMKDGCEAKFWLRDGRLAVNAGFSPRDLAELRRAVEAEKDKLLEAWNDVFGG